MKISHCDISISPLLGGAVWSNFWSDILQNSLLWPHIPSYGGHYPIVIATSNSSSGTPITSLVPHGQWRILIIAILQRLLFLAIREQVSIRCHGKYSLRVKPTCPVTFPWKQVWELSNNCSTERPMNLVWQNDHWNFDASDPKYS